MFANCNFVIYLVFIIAQESTIGEWVEVPQFSDSAKIYRFPVDNKFGGGKKYFMDHNNRPIEDGERIVYGNWSSTGDKFHRRYSQFGAEKTTTHSTRPGTSKIITATNQFHPVEKDPIVVTKIPDNFESSSSEDVLIEDAEVITQTSFSTDDKIVMDGDQIYQAPTEENQVEENSEEPEGEDENNDGKPSFLALIPLDLFRKVHAILKSQSTTSEGKIEFLKRFEKTLLAEIEKRLIPVINPVRIKRESRGDHGWDDHDDSVGFPSLEGALMAISFLTFAVYLVQLVMMLFRNLGSNNTNTPGTATVLLNRNKRSIDKFTEDTAMILDYLDTFMKNQTNN